MLKFVVLISVCAAVSPQLAFAAQTQSSQPVAPEMTTPFDQSNSNKPDATVHSNRTLA